MSPRQPRSLKKDLARHGAGKKKSTRRRLNSRSVHRFRQGDADGGRDDKELLGGKGANLSEMCGMGLPVPPGFTIPTTVCGEFNANGHVLPADVQADVEASLAWLEEAMQRRLGDPDAPLLVSVRSGARVSMPGMMDTVLNLGLNDKTVAGLARRSGNERFAWDAYRRFIQMFGDVVLGVRAQHDDERDPFASALSALKQKRGVKEDTDLTADDLRLLVKRYRAIVKKHTGTEFPQDPREQLRAAIAAVFRSWDNERAVTYRRINGFSSEWGTAVSVVAMVFGNMGESSGTGVAFTRNPSTGEKRFYGEYLINAQGEDVVAGIRTPLPIASLAQTMPACWKELQRIQALLEKHYRDMQDLEFTIEDGKLWMLQCRNGKRTGFAAVRIASDLVRERRITKQEALLRIEPEALEQLLEPVFDPAALKLARSAGQLLTQGLNAGPGAATGRVVFTANRAEEKAAAGWPVILVRIETSPEDIHGMQAAVGILTARGGMTSHAALVARQMGKVCVAGAGELLIDASKRTLRVAGQVLREGDWLSLDGSTGEVFRGEVPTRPSEVLAQLLGKGRKKKPGPAFQAYQRVMKWADEARSMGVRTNADQPDQAQTAISFGAEGIGLCRTEHMFFEDEKITAVREMILAEDAAGRERALAKLLPLQRKDFAGIFRAMGSRPVTIRTLDPPLHEFLPQDAAGIRVLAKKMGVSTVRLTEKVESLREVNPMLGHRGCRLGIVYPEITRMQARAIFEAACDVKRRTKITPKPEVMIPLIGTAKELELQRIEIDAIAKEVFKRRKCHIPYLVGTMIELPRAALTADEIAQHADFFSFGTNDLTQTTFGISRDDSGHFVPAYVNAEIIPNDPFAVLDAKGVGRLMRIAVDYGLATVPGLKLGICGEHGGDPASIAICQDLGLDYVSCSPYRVPIARLAAAQAALRAT